MFFGSNNLLVLALLKGPPIFTMKMNLREKQTEKLIVVIRVLLTFREQFYGFLSQYFDIFKEIKNSSVYITGESYAGYFV
jgi:hypothetical protein